MRRVPLLLLCLVLGCGRSHPMAPVSGSVTLKGKPLTSGRVIFIHELGFSNFGDIEEDGTYWLMAPVGETRVAVECLEDPLKRQQGHNPYNDPKALAQSLIPPRYSNHMTSGFTVDVKPGENKADFALED